MQKVPRISASSYANTAPLVWSFLYGANRGRFELIMDNAPARSAELLAQKRVDAALVPVIEYQRIAGVLLVPDVCVGAREKARSVCLVTKGEDLRNVKSAALDISSRTSGALTKIIFQEFYGFQPSYKEAKPNLAEMLQDSDCALLIGDPALAVDEKIYRKFDLAEIWKEFTDFGFVFAMWMTHSEKAQISREIDFAAARDEGLLRLNEIVANYETEIYLPKEDFKEYLSKNISYKIDDSMRKGLELYFRLAYKHELVESLKPPRFIDD
ncbi:MAG TPA: menaquinone biosynthesis protein [Pyrinomonadaceae bacterium]|nr:menaquinone biosynthesis protein [Pyrinomonadaceae bacterium]